MITFDSIGSAIEAVRTAAYTPTDKTPEMEENLKKAAAEISPVVAIVAAAEYIYAAKDNCSNELLELGAALASLAAENGWHSIKEDRGVGMVRALRRESNEIAPSGSWPEKDKDPDVNELYAEKTVQEVPMETMPENMKPQKEPFVSEEEANPSK